MRIGIDVPALDSERRILDANGIMVRAKMVEESGLDGIWTGDGSYFRGAFTECDPILWSVLCAAGTHSIEIGLSVLQVSIREPIDLANRLMSAAALTRNRFTCGVGAGSTREGAFDAVGVSFENRFEIFYQKMEIIQRLIRGHAVNGGITMPPWPETQGGPRFVLGAWHSATSIRHAVEEFDGWMTSARFTNITTMTEGIKRFRDCGGKRAMVSTCAIDLRAPSKVLSDEEPFNLVCGPQEAAERLFRLAELGYDDVCVRFCNHLYRGPGLDAANYTMDDLQEIRSLIPRDECKPYVRS